jgi:hypothetical protein
MWIFTSEGAAVVSKIALVTLALTVFVSLMIHKRRRK